MASSSLNYIDYFPRKKSLNLDSLDDELLFQILKRLPIILVHRSKCVSKRWLKIISTDYFFKSYNLYWYLLSCSKSHFALINEVFVDEQFNIRVNISENFNSFDTDFITAPKWLMSSFFGIHVLASHHGLVLCSAISAEYHRRCQYFICNLLFKKWIRIPQPPTIAKHARLGLINNNIISVNFDASYSFMIVRLPNDDSSDPKVEVYDSETGMWTVSLHGYGKASTHVADVDSSAVACNGLLFWRRSHELLVFDPRKIGFHRFSSIKLLDKMQNMSQPHYWFKDQGSFFGECNGRLRCASYTNWWSKSLDIWERGDCDIYPGKWCFVATIKLPDEVSSQVWVTRADEMGRVTIGFHPFDDNVVFVACPRFIVLYDIHQNDSIKIWRNLDLTYAHSGPLLLPTVLPWLPQS